MLLRYRAALVPEVRPAARHHVHFSQSVNPSIASRPKGRQTLPATQTPCAGQAPRLSTSTHAPVGRVGGKHRINSPSCSPSCLPPPSSPLRTGQVGDWRKDKEQVAQLRTLQKNPTGKIPSNTLAALSAATGVSSKVRETRLRAYQVSAQTGVRIPSTHPSSPSPQVCFELDGA